MNRKDHMLGEVFHTALRKGSDTTWSSLLWNLIHATSDEPDGWPDLLKTAEPLWHGGKSIKDSVLAWVNNGDVPHSVKAKSLKFALELCDQETWDDVEGFVTGYWADDDE